jgi:hypothetical protein
VIFHRFALGSGESFTISVLPGLQHAREYKESTMDLKPKYEIIKQKENVRREGSSSEE